uniref:Germacrene A oxidase n=1 Tax=Lygus hesperus TaxID=30085 RepID=A0A0A9Z6Y2_LYGHE
MYTFKTFFVLTLASYVVAAPPTDEPAECKPMKDKEDELRKCCKIESISAKEQSAFQECMKLVKDGDKKGPPKPEGYECIDDCIMAKNGYLGTDKKIDPAKVNAAAKTTYTGEWAEPGAKMVEKCLAQVAAIKEKGECTSGADVFSICLFRESFINCPEKSWTSSDTCKANKERLIKCPKSLPFLNKPAK